MEILEQNFVDPPWESKLDTATVLRRIPETATIAGMYFVALTDDARRRGTPLSTARDRYVPFQFYPTREYVQLLLECCTLFHPRRSLRTGLRKLGHQAVHSLFASTIGKVILASKDDVKMVLSGIVQTYPVNLRPSVATLLAYEQGRAIVRLEEIPFFLDSHHVGVFEGTLRFAGKHETSVRICTYSSTSADLLCTWET